MELNLLFFVNSALLGLGLAMDAFSVSLANGLQDTQIKLPKMSLIAGTYAFFQFIMPMIGWICVHTVVQYFTGFQKFVPFIALLLLLYIGGKMIFESFCKKEDKPQGNKLGINAILLQGVATSIDALSVGFTISDYSITAATVCGLVIAVVTFLTCMLGIQIGKKFGTGFSDRAGLLGGVILVLIGIEIFVKGIFF